MISRSKILSIVLLLSIVVISILLSQYMNKLHFLTFQKMESFDTYSASLLNRIGPIVFDSSTLSTDKITSLQKITPPISDTTILSYVNSGGDPDGIISNIKTYLGSCPSSTST